MNAFATLSAESAESHLATVSASEVYTDDRPECVILPDDITYREDDRNVRVWDVWHGNEIVSHGHGDYISAATWANDNNYRIAPSTR